MFKKYFNVPLIGLVIAIIALVISTRGIAQHIGLTALGKGFSDNTSDDFLTRLRFSLQMGTFSPPTPAPTPIPTEITIPTTFPKTTLPTPTPKSETCPLYGEITNGCTCQTGETARCFDEPGDNTLGKWCFLGRPYCENIGSTCFDENLTLYLGKLISPSACNKRLEEGKCTPYCIGKPVIYLYPVSRTLVDVRLDTPGEVFISDPLYPKDGWQGVTAYPDGHLIYKNKEYPYLYYELAVSKPKIPPRGIVIKKEELSTRLLEITGKLGLIRHEQQDFLAYWLPRLEKTNKPYIVFSLLDKEEKEKVDPVAVSPAPTTRIEFLVNYQPVDYPVTVEPLIFNEVPQRTGFTMVEWGGGISE